jgi:hypothetical protein
MLHSFVVSNRDLIISRCKAKVAMRCEPAVVAAEADHGVPLFLQQLVKTLQAEQRTDVRDGADAEPTPARTDIGRAAALHGAELLRRGFSVDQVVRDYGDVCQSITTLAVEQNESITSDEFRTLNRCLDNAIADAVTSYGSAHQRSIELEAQTLQKRLGDFAIEHRRLVDIAVESLAAIRTGNMGIRGATGTLLTRALEELGSLTDRALARELSPIRSGAVFPG